MRVPSLAVGLLAIAVLTAGCTGPDHLDGPADPDPRANETTTTFDVKADLVREYNPGTNRGMPAVITEEQVNETLAQNPELVDRIQVEFNVTDRRDTYHRVKQFGQVQVSENTNGTWSFTVSDANSCTITHINGTYDEGEITETNRTEEGVPC